jgi:hypothetical protein
MVTRTRLCVTFIRTLPVLLVFVSVAPVLSFCLLHKVPDIMGCTGEILYDVKVTYANKAELLALIRSYLAHRPLWHTSLLSVSSPGIISRTSLQISLILFVWNRASVFTSSFAQFPGGYFATTTLLASEETSVISSNQMEKHWRV